MFGKKDFHSGSLRLEGLPSTITVVVRPDPSIENSIAKHRDKAQIIASILVVTSSSGATRKKIVYKSFLSYKLLHKYLSFMLEKCSIETRQEKRNSTSFISTDRGRRLLYLLNQINEMIGRKKEEDEEDYTWY
jgi:predicted transcriptional regulator